MADSTDAVVAAATTMSAPAPFLRALIERDQADLRQLLDQLPVGLMMFDAAGRVIAENVHSTLDWASRDGDFDRYGGRVLSLDHHPLPRERFPVIRALRGNESIVEDVVVRSKGRADRVVRVTAFPISGAEGRPGGAIAVFDDVTEASRRARALEVLAETASALAEPGDLDELLRSVLHSAVPRFADAAALLQLVDGKLFLTDVVHIDPSVEQTAREMFAFGRRPVPPGSELYEGVLHTVPLLAPQYGDVVAGAGISDPHAFPVIRGRAPFSLLSVPLVGRGLVHGLLLFVHDCASGRRFSDDDEPLAQELARRCGLVVDQILARRALDAALARSQAIHDLATGLAAAITAEDVAELVVEHCAGLTGDARMSLLLDTGDGETFRFLHGRNVPAGQAGRWQTIDIAAPLPLTDAIRTGQPVVLHSLAEMRARYPLLLEREGRALGGGSLLVHPLFSRSGGRLGALGFIYHEDNAFDATVERMLATVAELSGQALDRARRYDAEHAMARTLQLALLPPAMPELPSMQLAVRYVPGLKDADVGGDWYDAIVAGDRVVLVIGDVAGRGVPAATVMSAARHAIGAAITGGAGPAAALDLANRYFEGRGGEFVTCCVVEIAADASSARLASAGHLPPVLRRDGRVELVSMVAGPPLGTARGHRFRDAELSLDGVDSLVLYTDGLVERRGEHIDRGIDRVLQAMGEVGLRDVDALADALLSQVGEASLDDTALLAASFGARPPRFTARLSDVGELSALRHGLAAWLSMRLAAEPAADLVLAADELATNGLRHAGPLRTEVVVTVGDRGSHLEVVVRDDGTWREPAPDHDGRGLEIAGRVLPDLRLSRTPVGTTVSGRLAKGTPTAPSG